MSQNAGDVEYCPDINWGTILCLIVSGVALEYDVLAAAGVVAGLSVARCLESKSAKESRTACPECSAAGHEVVRDALMHELLLYLRQLCVSSSLKSCPDLWETAKILI
eukprot:4921483-Amphidinium_carterae.1